MIDWLVLAVAGIFLAICIFGGFVLLRRRRDTLEQMEREAAAETIIDLPKQTAADGGVIAGDPPPPTPLYRRRGAGSLLVVLAGLFATLLIVTAGFVFYDRSTTRAPERFVVLVAPFADGGDGATGRNVATELAQALNAADSTISALTLNQAPTSPDNALAIVEDQGADLLIYGNVAPGALLDSATLEPRLIYRPSGPYGPNAWDGYQTRFAMPRSFGVADTPINGRAVLVPLVRMLSAYSQGHADQVFDQLGQLLEDYPTLNVQLPRAVRGTILWARGLYPDAAAEYRLALEVPGDDPARLVNNLGAILLDAGDPDARSAFAEAVRLLQMQNSDLGVLRVNLAVLAQREQRAVDAVVELEQARNLLGSSTPLQIALADAYRDTGRLADAEASITQATDQLDSDSALTPPGLRPMYRLQQQAALDEQRALLGLAQQLETQGPLVWELELAPILPIRVINSTRDQMQIATERSNLALARWRQRSASDAAGFAGVGLVAAGQVERVEQQLLRQRYYAALIDIEVNRARSMRGRSAVNRAFDTVFGGPSPLSEGLTILRELNEVSPNNPPLLVALGRAQRAADAGDDAEGNFTRAITLAPQQPEGYFGLGMLALDRNNPDFAQDRFNAALVANANFFPARSYNAQLARDRGDWATATAQYQALYTQRPGPRSAVALGQTLRLSGPAGFADAEQVLLPYSTEHVAATIELARLYNDAGQNEAAINTYRAALSIDARSSTAAFELGERLRDSGDYTGAESAFRDAVGFDEAHVDARLALADLYQGPLNNPTEARRQYSLALDNGVQTTAQLIAIGDSLLASDNPTQAIRAFEAAFERPDVDVSVNYKLAQAHLATDRLAAAETAAQRTLAAVSGDPSRSDLYRATLIQLGTIAQREGDIATAASYFAQANQLQNQDVAALLGLGQVAAAQGSWAVAVGYFEQAVAQTDGAVNPEAQLWLGEGLLRIDDLPRAAAAYQTALDLKPGYAEAVFGMAQVRYAQGDRNGALAEVDQAIELRANFAEAQLFRGKLLQEAGLYNEALVAYNASITANGDLAESRYWRGVLHIRDDNFEDAVSDLGRAVEIQPIFPEAHYWLGRAYFAQGRAEQAQASFRLAIEQNGQFVEALFYSGQAAEDLGNRTDALSAYQTVIQLDSDGEWGRRAQAQLNRLG